MIKYLFLIFVLMISCSTRHEEGFVIYFEDGYVDDGPFGFPDFAKIEHREPNLIYQFEDIEIDRYLFSQIGKAIADASPKKSEFSIDFHEVKAAYLLFPDSTKNCFFNYADEFYNVRGEHLFHNVNLATAIKRLINYDEVLEKGIDPDIPPPVYYKVVVKVGHEEK